MGARGGARLYLLIFFANWEHPPSVFRVGVILTFGYSGRRRFWDGYSDGFHTVPHVSIIYEVGSIYRSRNPVSFPPPTRQKRG